MLIERLTIYIISAVNTTNFSRKAKPIEGKEEKAHANKRASEQKVKL